MGWYGPQTGDCSCCPVECEIATDDFNRGDSTNLGADWTERLGGSGWEISSNVLTTAVANDVVTHNDGHPDDESDLRVWARVRGAIGDQLRIIVCYVDNDTYLFGQLEIGSDCVYLSIWKRASGSNTQLGDTQTICCDYPLEWHWMVVCHQAEYYPDDAWLSAQVETSDHRIGYVKEDVDSDVSEYGGLGTGTLAGTPVAEFDDFALWILQSPSWPQCPDCEYRTCVIYHDTFDRPTYPDTDLGSCWDETTGADYLAISSDKHLAITGGPTLALCTVLAPEVNGNQYLYVSMRIAGPSLAAYIYLDYDSATDFHRLTITSPAGEGGQAHIELHSCVAGVETSLGSTVINGWGLDQNFNVCIGLSESAILARVSGYAGLPGDPAYAENVTISETTSPTGGRAAGLGSSAGSYGLIEIYDFQFDRLKSDDYPECPTCLPGYCGGCSDEPPVLMKVTFRGFIGDCDYLNGSYIVSHQDQLSDIYKCIYDYQVGSYGGPDYRFVRFQTNAGVPAWIVYWNGAGPLPHYFYAVEPQPYVCQSLDLELFSNNYSPCQQISPDSARVQAL